MKKALPSLAKALALVSVAFLSGPGATQAAGDYTKVRKAAGTTELFRFLKYSDEKSKKALCVAPLKGDAKGILDRAGVKTQGAKESELVALAKGVQQIQALAGGNGFTAIKGAKVVFKNDSPKSSGEAFGRFRGGFVSILRNGSKPAANSAHLIHELAHHIGNQEGLYGKYRSYVGKGACQFSERCRHMLKGAGPRNEEFAEVFAAFVLHPELLQKTGPNCQRAYEFFATKVFPKGGHLAKCGATIDPKQTIAKVKTPVSTHGDEAEEDDEIAIPLPPRRPRDLAESARSLASSEKTARAGSSMDDRTSTKTTGGSTTRTSSVNRSKDSRSTGGQTGRTAQ